MAPKVQEPKKNTSFEELLQAGIKAIAGKGIDRVTVGDITALSHHSRPTFYTYFGDLNGFLAELWLHFGIGWLDDLLEEPFEEFKNPELNRALVQIISISHRNSEVAEVLFPDLQQWFDARTAGGRVKQVMLVWYLSLKLGMFLSMPIAPLASSASVFLKLLASAEEGILENPKLHDLKNTKIGTRPPMRGIAAVEDDLERRILASTIEVVANAGVAAASMARIARKARVSTGTIYPRYKSTDLLISASYDQAIRQIVAGNVEQLEANVGPDEFGAIVVAGFHDSRKSWRNYRLELYLEALINPEFAKTLTHGLEETRMLLDSNLQKYGYSELERLSLTHLMQNQAVGISILFNAGLPVTEMDHRIPPRYIQLLTTK